MKNDIEKIKYVLENSGMVDALLNKAIRILEKQLNGGWISVKERLPNEDKIYVICTDGTKVRELFYRDKKFLSGVLDQTNQVVAWQPLPEPWKEGISDGKDYLQG